MNISSVQSIKSVKSSSLGLFITFGKCISINVAIAGCPIKCWSDGIILKIYVVCAGSLGGFPTTCGSDGIIMSIYAVRAGSLDYHENIEVDMSCVMTLSVCCFDMISNLTDVIHRDITYLELVYFTLMFGYILGDRARSGPGEISFPDDIGYR
ncbi:hypothetical protein OROMI_020889 [Orobanche minor]